MLIKFLLGQFRLSTQVGFLRTHGVMVGTRRKGKRQAYLYMFRNLFAEVIYHHDDPLADPESIKLFDGLGRLNYYLEKEFKSLH